MNGMSNGAHVMVDIETMGTGHDAAIVSIGACAFDINDPDSDITETFSARITLQSNARAGRKFEAGTIEWWLKQSQEAQAGLFKEPISSLRSAVTEFRMWVDNLQPKAHRIWAKDPDFDVVLLRHAFDQVGQMWPFSYWMSRSVRTIIETAYPDGDPPNMRVGTHHDASDDAITQALLVRHCWARLQLGQRALSP